ncbi:MAG: helix-turn-helix transcriptional regulator [Syntrophaceae bacterium]|nr:helix-turn-helix transcriptional regulator [Syntrophaceae bacterium]
MKTTDRKFTAGELEVLEWLKGQPKAEEVLKKIKALKPIDWEGDTEFVANSAKGQVTEDILAVMEMENINRSQLAERLGKSRQYVSRILNETANFTIDSLAEIAIALNRKIEVRMIGKTQHIFIADNYKTVKDDKYTSMKSAYSLPDTAVSASEKECLVAEKQAEYNTEKDRENEKKFHFAA